ncbi:MAG: HlyD family efflux transporter periplasmic adaptor subunit [Gammaproteobacteria bacterium]|jgi:HlyD family secretion protein|nr:HlyD family efflux transporter periplasmic adaptor subunit [Gammaproteobacteria bacterium]
MHKSIILILGIFLAACEEPIPIAVGLLESDRVEIVVESFEPIISINVIEGQTVDAGDLLLMQDNTRIIAREAEAKASIASLEAILAEQIAGPRNEVIEAARATLQAAQVQFDINLLELNRLERLGADVATQERIDLARSQRDAAQANIEQTSARLRELEAGTRLETIEQTRQQIAGANARLDTLLIDKSRLNSIAPVNAIIDSLPFEVGERPPVGSVVAVLLTGEQPYARVYVPEALRINVRPGTQVSISIDGIEMPFNGTVRRISSEASFTPYFSLTESDRGRLSYLAEIIIETQRERLPDGVPVEVIF